MSVADMIKKMVDYSRRLSCSCEVDMPDEENGNGHPVTFQKELEALLNRYCKENGSDTPDFILAEYFKGCLKAFDKAVRARETWYSITSDYDPLNAREGGYGDKSDASTPCKVADKPPPGKQRTWAIGLCPNCFNIMSTDGKTMWCTSTSNKCPLCIPIARSEEETHV